MANPKSQKHGERPISFMLWDEKEGQLGEYSFVIRPEELSKQEPSRNTVQQTFGGAWLDSFGKGVSQINISGTTGWRGSAFEDGADLFEILKDTCFDRWHSLREENIKNGVNPDNIQLIFTDFLDNISVVCAPMQFTLKRHKSRPLLMQYNINLTVLGSVSEKAAEKAEDPLTIAITHPKNREKQALVSLGENISSQKDLASDMRSFFTPLTDSTSSILDFTSNSLEELENVINSSTGVFDASIAPILKSVRDIQQAGRNAFSLLTTVSGVGEELKSLLMNASSMLGDAYCNIVNGFGLILSVSDFSDLFGASTCSSTGGGRPISKFSHENPFLALYNVDNPVATVNITEKSSSAAFALLQDPLSSTATESEILGLAQEMIDGIKFGIT